MRIRDKLENMLIDKGMTVDHFWGATGQWRKSCMDVMRWEANCRRSDGRRIHIGSWDTMTECVRRGFTLDQEKEPYEVMAYANEKTKGIQIVRRSDEQAGQSSAIRATQDGQA
jgi:hypothetical protein